MAEPKGLAINLSETAGDPSGRARRILMAQGACIDGRTTVFGASDQRRHGNGLNFWDRQNRVIRVCPGGPCGNPVGRFARCGQPADGIGDDQWTDLRNNS